MTADKLHALFFDSRGNGPDNVSLWTEPVRPVVDDGKEIATRTLGLRVDVHVEHVGDERHFEPLLFARAGGYQMDEATVRALHAHFGAWLDAPRLAARANAEVVAEDDGYRLLRTAHEWGVRYGGSDEPVQTPGEMWFTGEDAERDARRLYAEERGKVICECGAEVDEDDALHTEDGTVCPACAKELHQEWLRSDVECVGADSAGCGWRGKGADAAMVGEVSERRECPTCGGDVELVDDALVVESTAPEAEEATSP